MLWGDETHLPAWPAGTGDGRSSRALRAAKAAMRRLTVVRDDGLDADTPPAAGDAA